MLGRVTVTTKIGCQNRWMSRVEIETGADNVPTYLRLRREAIPLIDVNWDTKNGRRSWDFPSSGF